MTSVVIRLEEARDRPASLQIEELAFGGPEEVRIVEAVRDEAGSFALVATDEDEVVAHVQLSRAWVGEQPVLALGPIGVRPDRQGAGIGSALVRAALQEARSRGEVAVILLGSQDYYPRFGFRPAASWGLRNPFAGVLEDGFVIEEEHLMLAVLDEREHTFAGEARWHPAFGRAG